MNKIIKNLTDNNSHKTKIKIKAAAILLVLPLLLTAALFIYNVAIPDSVAYTAGSEMPTFYGAVADIDDGLCLAASGSAGLRTEANGSGALVGSFETQYRLLGVIPIKKVRVDVYKNLLLYPGGMPFGVKFYTDGVLVVGFADIDGGGTTSNPAYDAGIRLKDLILKADGRTLASAAELTDMIERSDGRNITLLCKRGGEEYTCTLCPKYSDAEGRFKTGMWIRDSGAGIGTVTFIVPDNKAFGGLGHGICDVDTGELIPMQRGIVSDVTVSGLVKGIAGNPGEIKGYFNSGKIGSLLGNTDCGVYGVFSTLPKTAGKEKMPIGLRGDVKDGNAYILCTLDGEGIKKYDISICEINREAMGSKCFTIKVTDPALTGKTGGIIQGMSGSPIIQNGKIIGAVTHVLINDPTTGYGIFIENMLTQMPELLK